MDYPFKAGQPCVRRSIRQKIRTAYETWRITRRERRNRVDVPLKPPASVAPLVVADLPLMFVTHNDMALLPYFLRHYRALGVTRFICVDDVSTDGAREYLATQPDVDLWTSPIRYGEARRGRNWREALFAHYGYDRWYVNVDSDEFLIYDGYQTRPLPELISVLKNAKAMRLAAPMIDMYPGPGGCEPDEENGTPWQFSNCFDADGYAVKLDKRAISLKGGPRRRCFGENNEMMKYPLLYWDRSCFFGASAHQPLPYERNFITVFGVLLHIKFFTDYRSKIREAATEKQHYNGAEHYQAMMDELDRSGYLSFVHDRSVQFRDAQQMIDLGLMTKISPE